MRLDYEEILVAVDSQVQEVNQAQPDHKDFLDHKGLLVCVVTQEMLVLQEHQDYLDLKDLEVMLDHQGHQGHLDQKVLRDFLDLWAHLAQEAIVDCKVPLVLLVQLEPLELQVLLVTKDQLVIKDQVDHLEQLVHPVQEVHQD